MNEALRQPGAVKVSQRARLTALRARVGRGVLWTLVAIVVAVPAAWVLFLAPTTGRGATAFGSAVHDPKDFLITCLNGVTAAGPPRTSRHSPISAAASASSVRESGRARKMTV